MKLKIVHQNRTAAGETAMKEETVEVEGVGRPPADVPADDALIKDSCLLLGATPVSAYGPLLVSGKRRRKPKEMTEDYTVFRRRKRGSAAKNKDGTLDSGGTSMSKGDATTGGSSSAFQYKSPIILRAEEFQSSLVTDQPSCLKPLVRSHVGSCFWMGLPVPFCKLHLPTNDTIVTLESETGEEFPVKYIAHKTGLSAGWRKFVTGNKLLEGDVLIFQLTEPCRLKIYIIRANDLTEVDGALSLLILDSQTKQSDAILDSQTKQSDADNMKNYHIEGATDARTKKKRRPKSLPLTVVQKKKHKDGPLRPHFEEPSGNDSDEVASEVLEGSKSSASASHFKDISSFEEFNITVNGVCIDSEIPEQIRRKYYDLCCSKKAFLHNCLLPGLYCKLAAGMIVEAVNIVDAVGSCKLTTPRKEFEVWEKSLRSFELLGFNVGFIRDRVRRLLSMVFESGDGLETRRYLEARMDLSRTEEEIQLLQAKLVELKELSARYERDMENLKLKAERYELMFQEEVDASW